jgi:hypothetical protein
LRKESRSLFYNLLAMSQTNIVVDGEMNPAHKREFFASPHAYQDRQGRLPQFNTSPTVQNNLSCMRIGGFLSGVQLVQLGSMSLMVGQRRRASRTVR